MVARTKREERVSHEQETWDEIDLHGEIPEIVGEFGPLPEVPARKGFAQRWIRTKKAGEDDAQNASRAFNRHWRRRDPSTIPQNISAPTIYVEGIGNAIGISGMILMERPDKIHDAYKKRVDDRTKAQKAAVTDSLSTNTSAKDGFGEASPTTDKTEAKIGSGIVPDEDE